MGAEIVEIATTVGELIVSLFQTLAGVFYVQASGSGDTAVAGHLTIFGYLLLFSALVGLTIFVINWIKSVITIKK